MVFTASGLSGLIYEVDVNLVASVIKALSSVFPDYVIYAADDFNILIVAKKEGEIGRPDSRMFEIPGLAMELKRIGIQNVQDLENRRIGDRQSWDPLFASIPIPPNSDYFPVLDLKAARTRFLGSTASEVVRGVNPSRPVYP